MTSKKIAGAVLLSAFAFGARASADTWVAGCVPQDTGYSTASGGQMQLLSGSTSSTCSTFAYYYAAQAISGTCSTQNKSADTIKIWLGLAQAAVLSGKKLNFSYVTCGGINWITSVQLERT